MTLRGTWAGARGPSEKKDVTSMLLTDLIASLSELLTTLIGNLF
ncbi:hypothetical protein [Streptomyces sp. NBC_01190]|nr:hypothetical protein OG519_15015 [Streptomyces sp. NBC_01190]